MTGPKVLLMVAAMLTGMDLLSLAMLGYTGGECWRILAGTFASAFGLYASWQLLGSLIEEAAVRAKAETWKDAAELVRKEMQEGR